MSPSKSLILALTLLAGCSSNHSGGNVTVRGDDARAVMAQSFDQAFISGSHDGQFDVLLIQDPTTRTTDDKGLNWNPMKWSIFAGQSRQTIHPIDPTAAAQLRQVVHLHIFWQADGGSVERDGVVTNAAIDWYVIAHEASDRPDILHYQGAGYVLLDAGGKVTTVRIRDGIMKQSDVRGEGLQDPFGPSKLAGTVKAQRNSGFVKQTLADLRAATATSTPASAAQVSSASR